MSKKLSPAKKGNAITKLGDPPGTKIRETLVGDPSINFTVALDQDLLRDHVVDGITVVDFRVEVWLTDVPASDTEYVKVATVHVTSLSSFDPYFFLPFGDPDYGAGQTFWMKLRLSGRYPDTKKRIRFNNNGNWFIQHLMGGGILEDGRKRTKPKKRKK